MQPSLKWQVDLKNAQACLDTSPPDPGGALLYLQKATFIAPQESSLYALRSEAYVLECDFCSAVLNLQKSVACAETGRNDRVQQAALRRRLSEVMDAHALVLLSAGEAEAAEGMFTAAIQADRTCPGPPFHLAIAQFSLTKYHGALQSLESAVALSPKDARLYLLRAKVYWQTKNYGHAAENVAIGLKAGRLSELVALSDDLRAQVNSCHCPDLLCLLTPH
jgi:tetratricopeptide (TPR) repeat protein